MGTAVVAGGAVALAVSGLVIRAWYLAGDTHDLVHVLLRRSYVNWIEKPYGNVEHGLDGCFLFVTADGDVPDDDSLNVYSRIRMDNTRGESTCEFTMDFADGSQVRMRAAPGEEQVLILNGERRTTWRQGRLERVA